MVNHRGGQQYLSMSFAFFPTYMHAIFHFSSEISFGPLFIDIWRLFTGHAASELRLNTH